MLDLAEQMAGSLGGVAGELGKRVGSAQRLDVFVENLIGGRRAGVAGLATGRTSVGVKTGVAVDGVDGRRDGGALAAAMAGPASHHLASVEILLIDVVHHLDHAAGDDLARRIVFPIRIGGAGAGMAILAAEAQGGGEQAHGAHELVDRNAFQTCDVLEVLLRTSSPRTRLGCVCARAPARRPPLSV